MAPNATSNPFPPTANLGTTRTFPSMCDVCLAPVPGEVLVEGDLVFLCRHCPEHGERRMLLSRNGERYLRLDRAYHRIFPPDRPVQPTVDTYFFITNRCNQNCHYCATEANRFPYFGDMDLDFFRQSLARTSSAKISLIGGEPMVHPRLMDFAEAVRATGKTLVLYTNGVGLDGPDVVKRLLDAAGRLEIRMTVEGAPGGSLGAGATTELSAAKVRALGWLERLDVPTVLGHTILADDDPESSRRTIRSIVEYAMTHDFVRGLTFQSAVALGASRDLQSTDMLSVDGVIDRVVEALPVRVSRNVTYPTQKMLYLAARVFGLPMCSYVQAVPLFHTRAGWVSLDRFFDIDRLDRELDRIFDSLPRTRAGIVAAITRAGVRSARARGLPGLAALVVSLLPVFARGYDFDSIPKTALPLVSISICDRHNMDATVVRRCEKSVWSIVRGVPRQELCSEMVLRQLHERVMGQQDGLSECGGDVAAVPDRR